MSVLEAQKLEITPKYEYKNPTYQDINRFTNSLEQLTTPSDALILEIIEEIRI